MKIKRILPYVVCAAIMCQGSSVLAASDSEITREDAENLTPDWDKRSKDISSYKTTNTKGYFSLGQETIEDDDDEDDDDDDDKEITFDQITGDTSEGSGTIASTAYSTGYGNSYWAKTQDDQWMLIENGAPAFGWKVVAGNWYYMNELGIMKTGWLNYNNHWYYLYSNGIMARNTWVGNYYINNDGIANC